MNLSRPLAALVLAASYAWATPASAQLYRYDYPHAHSNSTPAYVVRNPYQGRQYRHSAQSAYHYGRSGVEMYRSLRQPTRLRYAVRQMNRGYDHMSTAYYYRAMRRSYVPPRSPWD